MKSSYLFVLALLSRPAMSQPFVSDFNTDNPTQWLRADGWATASPFAVAWRADHAVLANGFLNLQLDNQPCVNNISQCNNQPYASGAYFSNDFYGYGRVAGRLQAAAGSGLVTSLFSYTGPSDGNPHDEIDFEILGRNTWQVQLNYFAQGQGGHEVLIDLGFDAAASFHQYAFEWTASSISWFVDNNLIYQVTTGLLPSTSGHIMANLWAVDSTVNNWAGEFNYTGIPKIASYDWISYSAIPEPSTLRLLLGFWLLYFAKNRLYCRK